MTKRKLQQKLQRKTKLRKKPKKNTFKRKTTKRIKKRQRRTHKKRNMKGGAIPFSELGNLWPSTMYHAHNAISPLTSTLADDHNVNPNPTSQFQNQHELVHISGPSLAI